MQKRQIGRSGLRVSTVGLGCNNFGWRIDQEASNTVVAKALDLGITLFDTADRYGTNAGDSEIVLGQSIGAATQGHRAAHEIRRGLGECAPAR